MPEREKIKNFLVLRQLGKGGMGEVFLVKDPFCQRKLALKIIREDMQKNRTLRLRFLQEAKIAARLTHPNIIPIYQIYEGKDTLFYTMPYVEGETLKEILKTTRAQQKEGKITHPIGSSIPTLLRIFLNVCEAMAYSHAQGILHRDLKPDNIIVGSYGETLILDWGLACGKEQKEEELFQEDIPVAGSLTKPGKVPGTLSHMSPERALGEKASMTTDIYALGVILYQLLTLKLPFHRTTLQALRLNAGKEKLGDPLEAAPYRDIPSFLSDIVKRCLALRPKERYESVDKLIVDIKGYIEGKPHWVFVDRLNKEEPSQWLFQELIPQVVDKAVTGSTESLEWVMLMVAKASIRGNFCLKTRMAFHKGSQGIGFVLNIVEPSLKRALQTSFTLTLSPKTPLCILQHFRSHVIEAGATSLELDKSYDIRIEKIDEHFFVYLDDQLLLNYPSYFLLTGEYFGLCFKDFNHSLEEIHLYSGSQRTMVSCLAIPDTFLAYGDYDTALLEYRKVALSFEGRSEGREALFRAGLTILEQGVRATHKREKEASFLAALDEFAKLRKTPGAPLEYLGKSLVYLAWKQFDEEQKCLELALRKYPDHPLIGLIEDQILFRLHQSASKNKKTAFNFALLALRLLPEKFSKKNNLEFFYRIEKNLTSMLYVLPHLTLSSLEERFQMATLLLAILLDKPFVLLETIEKSSSHPLMENALIGLFYLGHLDLVAEVLPIYQAQKGPFLQPFIKALASTNKLKLNLSQLPSHFGAALYIALFHRRLKETGPKKEKLLELLKIKILTSNPYQEEHLQKLIFAASLILRKKEIIPVIFRENSLEFKTPIHAIAHLGYVYLNKGKEAAKKVLAHASVTDRLLILVKTLLEKGAFPKNWKETLQEDLTDDLTRIILQAFEALVQKSKSKKHVKETKSRL